MAFILANDGIDEAGKALLEAAGHRVQTDKVPQGELANFLKENNVAALLVRSATQVTAVELALGNLKVVGRAGVGMDNIDLVAAEKLHISVVNTPAASSRSVAELVMAHALGLLRFLPESNREMPARGNAEFAKLKKAFADGCEVEGRTLGIIGFGRIGRTTAKLALGMGMKVIAFDTYPVQCDICIDIQGAGQVQVPITTVTFDEVIAQSDILTLHVPGAADGAIIGSAEFAKMKRGAIIINAARGGVVDEEALLQALDSGQISGAGLDVFDNEPNPDPRLLNHPRISVTPHIGAATCEAQERIGIELAEKVIARLNG
jgi:D-3-phosphoglycerate dehydrogenase